MTEISVDGGIPFDNFVQHMVKRTSDRDSQDQILESFGELAEGKVGSKGLFISWCLISM